MAVDPPGANNDTMVDEESTAAATPRPPTPISRFPPEEEKQMLAAAMRQKQYGNTLFKSSHHHAAVDAYNLALTSTPLYLKDEVAVIHSNLAAAHLALEDGKNALSHAREAVQIRPGWIKPLLREGKAFELLGSWKDLEAAIAVLEGLLEGKGEGGVELETTLSGRDRVGVEGTLKRCREALHSVQKKETDEAMGKLKGLGAGFLRNFGVELGDFAMEEDGKGGYSLQYKKGASGSTPSGSSGGS